MASILERYRTPHAWPAAAREPGRDTQPLSHFVEIVDRLFYVAAAIFAVSLLALIVK